MTPEQLAASAAWLPGGDVAQVVYRFAGEPLGVLLGLDLDSFGGEWFSLPVSRPWTMLSDAWPARFDTDNPPALDMPVVTLRRWPKRYGGRCFIRRWLLTSGECELHRVEGFLPTGDDLVPAPGALIAAWRAGAAFDRSF